jgi:hypothetical protein
MLGDDQINSFTFCGAWQAEDIPQILFNLQPCVTKPFSAVMPWNENPPSHWDSGLLFGCGSQI